jgi:hypothetical protein
MLSKAEFSEAIDKQFAEELRLFFQTVPYATHLTDPATDLSEAYYLRHRIETIKRIKMTASTDALALAVMTHENYDLARKWAKYTVQEMNHDRMFIKDLEEHGYTESQINEMDSFESTKQLGLYLEDNIKVSGSMVAVTYSLFVEWNSERYSRKAVEKAEKQYSERHVSGSKAHVNFDEDQDHYQLIVGIAHQLIKNDEHERQLFQMAKDIAAFFRAYFTEVYQYTMEGKTYQPEGGVPLGGLAT